MAIAEPTKQASFVAANAFRVLLSTYSLELIGSLKPVPKTVPSTVNKFDSNAGTHVSVVKKTGFEEMVLPAVYNKDAYDDFLALKEAGTSIPYENSEGFKYDVIITDIDPQDADTDGGEFRSMNITIAFMNPTATTP